MTHLSADELKAWYERGSAGDRARVVAHLAECDACRRALSMLAVTAEPEARTPAITAAEAIPQGYVAQTPQQSEGAGWWSWLRPAYGLAAAAVVVLAVVMWSSTPRPDDGGDVVRSSELLAVSPGGSATTLEFRWDSPFAAARYRLAVRDASGTVVFSGETTASSMNIDATARPRFATMVEYSWTVSALDASGEVIAESKPRTFTYQP
jgi:predicted anti-sigma-YlaC factor YlaD